MWFNNYVIYCTSMWFDVIWCTIMWFIVQVCDSMCEYLIRCASLWFDVRCASMWFDVPVCDSLCEFVIWCSMCSMWFIVYMIQFMSVWFIVLVWGVLNYDKMQMLRRIIGCRIERNSDFSYVLFYQFNYVLDLLWQMSTWQSLNLFHMPRYVVLPANCAVQHGCCVAIDHYVTSKLPDQGSIRHGSPS